jgi:hypothetical protein
MDRISDLPLFDSHLWRDLVKKKDLRIENFFARTEKNVSSHGPPPGGQIIRGMGYLPVMMQP